MVSPMKKPFSYTFEWLCDNFAGLKPFSFDSKSDNDSRQFIDRDEGNESNGCLGVADMFRWYEVTH